MLHSQRCNHLFYNISPKYIKFYTWRGLSCLHAEQSIPSLSTLFTRRMGLFCWLCLWIAYIYLQLHQKSNTLPGMKTNILIQTHLLRSLYLYDSMNMKTLAKQKRNIGCCLQVKQWCTNEFVISFI